MKESDTRASRAPEPAGSGLHRYQATKLNLADLVRNLMDLARERGDERSHEAGRELLSRLASDRFDLAVLGQFSESVNPDSAAQARPKGSRRPSLNTTWGLGFGS